MAEFEGYPMEIGKGDETEYEIGTVCVICGRVKFPFCSKKYCTGEYQDKNGDTHICEECHGLGMTVPHHNNLLNRLKYIGPSHHKLILITEKISSKFQ